MKLVLHQNFINLFNVNYSRLLKDENLRSRWIEKISEQQNVEPTGFIICANHFNENDLKIYTSNTQKYTQKIHKNIHQLF